MKILFLGKEDRYEILIDTLKLNNQIYTIGYDNKVGVLKGSLKELNYYDIIVLPMSGIKNNRAGNVILQEGILDTYKGLIYTGRRDGLKGNVESFLDDDEIVRENTNITVDGIMHKIRNINKDSICILGYGNIGKKLYDRLKDNYLVIVGVPKQQEGIIKDSFVTSNKCDLKRALVNSKLIINTVPNHIIDEDILQKISGSFLDIASYPYAIDQAKIDSYPFDYQLYSSIPSKFAPDRAGKILLKKF